MKKFSNEEDAIIGEWATKYPRGKGFDLKRIKAEDGDRFASMLQAGHTERQIYQKAYYHRAYVIKDVERKPSDMPGGRTVECQICGESFSVPQALGAHMRYQHSKKTQARRRTLIAQIPPAAEINGTHTDGVTVTIPKDLLHKWVIVNSDGQVREVKLINNCPMCTHPIKSHLVAANL